MLCVCKSCGKSSSQDSRFCANCGNKLAEAHEKLCSCCNAKLTIEMNFCPDCGQQATPRNHDPCDDQDFIGNVTTNDASVETPAKISKYSVQSLLAIRTHKKNAGSPLATPAQKYFSDILRQAAQVARMWDTAPLARQITGKQWDKFWSQILCACPSLSTEKDVIKKRLLERLENRRIYLKKKREEKSPVVKSTDKQLQVIMKSPVIKSTDLDKQSGTLDIGKQVFIMHGEVTLGTGVVVRLTNQHEDPFGLFAEIVLHKKRIMSIVDNEDISLPKETESGIKLFKDLKEKEKFLWKKKGLMHVNTGTIRKPEASSKEASSTSKAKEASSTSKAKEASSTSKAKEASSTSKAKETSLTSKITSISQIVKSTGLAHGQQKRKACNWEFVPPDQELVASKAFEACEGPRPRKRKRLFDL